MYTVKSDVTEGIRNHKETYVWLFIIRPTTNVAQGRF